MIQLKKTRPRWPIRGFDSDSGSVLLGAVLFMVLLFMVFAAYFIRVDSVREHTDSFYQRKKAFYAVEGMQNISIALVQDYLRTTYPHKAEEIVTLLQTKLPELIPEPYAVGKAEVEILQESVDLPIPNGPYSGIIAPQTTVRFNFEQRSKVTGALGKLDVTITMAQFSMFQFLYFVDQPYSAWHPGQPQDIRGRVHINGDFCAGGSDTGLIRFLKVTASGRALVVDDPRCNMGTSGNKNVAISTNGDFTAFANLIDDADHGCTNCESTGRAWETYALSKFNGSLFDSAHGVQSHVLSTAKDAVSQYGLVASLAAPKSNQRNLRFLVDPVRTSDVAGTTKEKFAFKADIRIIDGVWYLKDPANEFSWPGIPIWSDHPGSAASFGLNVGQDDLRVARAWPTVPKRFSYYEYDSSSSELNDSGEGVISYGNLGRSADMNRPLLPGHWIETGPSSLCPSSESVTCAPCGLMQASLALTCSGGASVDRAVALLNGTRGGFVDGHLYRNHELSAALAAERSRVLPTNFDLYQFQEALRDTAPGELGSYFGSGRFMGREFNGIVFVSSTWSGSENGYGSSLPNPAPVNGAVADPNQIAVSSPTQQQALPSALCSNSKAGSKFDRSSRFKVPSCSGVLTYPQSVRLHNGRSLDTTLLRKGLSIVSNLPVYLAGNYNQTSDVSSGTSVPWVSALVAGDVVTILSEGWDDRNSRWDKDLDSSPRIASETTVNTALLAGWSPSKYDLGTHAFPALLENWLNVPFHFNGSMVIGFYPVYYMGHRYYDPAIYEAPKRYFAYDHHFDITSNNPPGTPFFSVWATLNWKRY